MTGTDRAKDMKSKTALDRLYPLENLDDPLVMEIGAKLAEVEGLRGDLRFSDRLRLAVRFASEVERYRRVKEDDEREQFNASFR